MYRYTEWDDHASTPLTTWIRDSKYGYIIANCQNIVIQNRRWDYYINKCIRSRSIVGISQRWTELFGYFIDVEDLIILCKQTNNVIMIRTPLTYARIDLITI